MLLRPPAVLYPTVVAAKKTVVGTDLVTTFFWVFGKTAVSGLLPKEAAGRAASCRGPKAGYKQVAHERALQVRRGKGQRTPLKRRRPRPSNARGSTPKSRIARKSKVAAEAEAALRTRTRTRAVIAPTPALAVSSQATLAPTSQRRLLPDKERSLVCTRLRARATRASKLMVAWSSDAVLGVSPSSSEWEACRDIAEITGTTQTHIVVVAMSPDQLEMVVQCHLSKHEFSNAKEQAWIERRAHKAQTLECVSFLLYSVLPRPEKGEGCVVNKVHGACTVKLNQSADRRWAQVMNFSTWIPRKGHGSCLWQGVESELWKDGHRLFLLYPVAAAESLWKVLGFSPYTNTLRKTEKQWLIREVDSRGEALRLFERMPDVQEYEGKPASACVDDKVTSKADNSVASEEVRPQQVANCVSQDDHVSEKRVGDSNKLRIQEATGLYGAMGVNKESNCIGDAHATPSSDDDCTLLRFEGERSDAYERAASVSESCERPLVPRGCFEFSKEIEQGEIISCSSGSPCRGPSDDESLESLHAETIGECALPSAEAIVHQVWQKSEGRTVAKEAGGDAGVEELGVRALLHSTGEESVQWTVEHSAGDDRPSAQGHIDRSYTQRPTKLQHGRRSRSRCHRSVDRQGFFLHDSRRKLEHQKACQGQTESVGMPSNQQCCPAVHVGSSRKAPHRLERKLNASEEGAAALLLAQWAPRCPPPDFCGGPLPRLGASEPHMMSTLAR